MANSNISVQNVPGAFSFKDVFWGMADTRYVIDEFTTYFNENGLYVGDVMYVYPGLKIFDPTAQKYFAYNGTESTSAFSITDFVEEPLGVQTKAFTWGGLIYGSGSDRTLITDTNLQQGFLYLAGEAFTLPSTLSGIGSEVAVAANSLLIVTNGASNGVLAKFVVFTIDLSGKQNRIDSTLANPSNPLYLVTTDISGNIFKSEIAISGINNPEKVHHVDNEALKDLLDGDVVKEAAKSKVASGAHTHNFGNSTFATRLPDAWDTPEIIHLEGSKDITTGGDRVITIADAPIIAILEGSADLSDNTSMINLINESYDDKINIYTELDINSTEIVKLLSQALTPYYNFSDSKYNDIDYVYIVSREGCKKVSVTLTSEGGVNYWTGIWKYNGCTWIVQLNSSAGLQIIATTAQPVAIASLGVLPDGLVFERAYGSMLTKTSVFGGTLYSEEFFAGSSDSIQASPVSINVSNTSQDGLEAE